MVSLAGLSAAFPGYQEAQKLGDRHKLDQFALQDAGFALEGKQALGKTFQAMVPGAQPMPGMGAAGAPGGAPQGPPMVGGAPPPMQPGQPSVPMMRPQQGPPMPGGPPMGGQPPPGGPPMGPQGPPPQGGGMPPGMPPPQGQFDIHTAATAIARANPGIRPEVLVYALKEAMPYLNAQAQNEVKQAMLMMRGESVMQGWDRNQIQADRLRQQQEQFAQKEKDFQQKEARLTTNASIRQDQGWQRLELQKADLERKITQGGDRQALAQWRAIVDAQHKRAMEVIAANSIASGLDDKNKKALLDEQRKAYEDDLNRMRDAVGSSTPRGGGGDPAASKPAGPKAQERAPAKQVLPEAFKNDPDGTQYKKDGRTWTKRGDALVVE